MKRPVRLGVPLLAAFFLAGCLETNTLVKVNRDGSGTVEETFLLSSNFLAMMQQMDFSADSSMDSDELYSEEPPEDAGYPDASSEDAGPQPQEPSETPNGGEAPDPVGSLPDEEQLAAEAQKMGVGVRLLSYEPLTNDRGNGYRVVYRFEDINQLRLNQNPSAAGRPASSAAAQDGEETAGPEEYLTFRFRKGNPATLQILSPKLQAGGTISGEEASEEMSEEDRAAMMDMLRQIYQDMRIRIAVEVQGNIVSTNAAYREGSKVTLVDLDFGRLLQNEAQFQKLARANPRTLQETKELLKNTAGIKLEMNDRVEVRFR